MKLFCAVLGYGTIGSKVVTLIDEMRDKFKQEFNMDVEVLYILDKDDSRIPSTYKDRFTSDISVIAKDKRVEVVFECLGGISFPKAAIDGMLTNKKTVITSNKDVIVAHGVELLQLARENNTHLYFDASVCGFIPLISNLESLRILEIDEISAILNGTTNYILYQMHEGMNFEDALKKAQQLGFAEHDPSSDILGLDHARKIIIIAGLLHRRMFDIDDVIRVGLDTVSEKIISYANDLNFVVKMIARYDVNHDTKEISLSVAPYLVSKDSPFANVNEEYNYVELQSDNFGKTAFMGKGAGGRPTASDMILDLISYCRGIYYDHPWEKLDKESDETFSICRNVTSKWLIVLDGDISHELARSYFARDYSVDKISTGESVMLITSDVTDTEIDMFECEHGDNTSARILEKIRMF